MPAVEEARERAIPRWLFKTPRDHSGVTATRNRSQRKSEDEVKPRDLVIYNRGGGNQSSKEGEEEDEEQKKSTFTILLRREDSRTCFYSTLHLKHLRSLYRNQNFSFPENSELRMGHKADSANVGCKVLPICDSVSTGSNGGDSSDGSEKDVQKGERRRAVSQMKELLKWAAAAARSHKGGGKGWKVPYFQNRIRHPLVEGGCSSSSSMDSSLSLASMCRNDRMLAKNSSNLSDTMCFRSRIFVKDKETTQRR
ncbi:hypothetical protein COCNU_09G009020 [Cocos nucifera]|uniref:Uncharacterized protein n=1 Tax=Cocos nucifera TaxID=13894 RepID=A0A8K0IL95_COCNU|nr:hypothetical protein COCNU_09G009020 [Cocos nucifera]